MTRASTHRSAPRLVKAGGHRSAPLEVMVRLSVIESWMDHAKFIALKGAVETRLLGRN